METNIKWTYVIIRNITSIEKWKLRTSLNQFDFVSFVRHVIYYNIRKWLTFTWAWNKIIAAQTSTKWKWKWNWMDLGSHHSIEHIVTKLVKIEKKNVRLFIVDMRAITSNDDRRFSTRPWLNPSGIWFALKSTCNIYHLPFDGIELAQSKKKKL